MPQKSQLGGEYGFRASPCGREAGQDRRSWTQQYEHGATFEMDGRTENPMESPTADDHAAAADLRLGGSAATATTTTVARG